jgi:hypothetical protein
MPEKTTATKDAEAGTLDARAEARARATDPTPKVPTDAKGGAKDKGDSPASAADVPESQTEVAKEAETEAQKDAKAAQAAGKKAASAAGWDKSYIEKREQARKVASASPAPAGTLLLPEQEGLIHANDPAANIARDPSADRASAVPDATVGLPKPQGLTAPGPYLPQTSEYGGQMPAVRAFEQAAETGIPSFGTGRVTDAAQPTSIVGGITAPGEDAASVSGQPPGYQTAKELQKELAPAKS